MVSAYRGTYVEAEPTHCTRVQCSDGESSTRMVNTSSHVDSRQGCGLMACGLMALSVCVGI